MPNSFNADPPKMMTPNELNELQEERTLNKSQLADMIADEFDVDRAQAKHYVEKFFQLISDHLANGGSIKIAGLGNFTTRLKGERPGRNLRTGEEVVISARRVVTYHPSGTLNARLTENLIGTTHEA